MEYKWNLDASQIGTLITVVGSGAGADAPSVQVGSSQPVGGLGKLPRLDRVFTFSNVNSSEQIAFMGSGISQQIGTPVATPTMRQPTNFEPVLGSWQLGDDARLFNATDDYYPNGVDSYWRIVQQSVTVPDEGVAEVTLTFNPVPLY
jgi:hypothetical protein